MGVANLNWYRDRNLLSKRTITLSENSLTVKFGKYKAGDSIEVEEPIVSYSCGRIDVRGGDTGPYGDEIGVPPMMDEDWYRFSDWLRIYETDDVCTLEQLVYVYELKNPKIRWAEENK